MVKDLWDAKYYKEHSKCQFGSGMELVYNLKFKGNENVLDVGCGDGRITFEIAKLLPKGQILGIDISQNMIDEAIKSFKNIKNLHFQCIDASKFLLNEKFDLIVSFAAFHWIKDQEKTLKNIYQMLKPDGKLIIKMSAYCKNPVSEIYESKKWAEALKYNKETYFPGNVDSFKKMLEGVGFKNIDIEFTPSFRAFENKEEIFNWVFAWAPASTGLSFEKAKEFTQDIVDKIIAANKPGELNYEAANLYIKAGK